MKGHSVYTKTEDKASPEPEKSRGKRCHLVPDAELEHLKRGIDLVALVRSYGVELKASGKDFVGRCPFHDDSHASLVVSPDKNLWHCMGACNMGGTTIDWVMRVEKVGFRRAVEILRERVGSSTAAGSNTAAEEENSAATSDKAADAGQSPANTAAKGKCKAGKTRLALPVEVTADEQKLLAQVADYYHSTLLKTTQPKDYLASRGIVGDEVIREFKIGFADRSLGMRIPHKQVKAGKEMREHLQKLGILRESGHELMTGSVVFPITDESGQITGMYGRKICNKLRKGTPIHLYLPGPHRGMFNAKCLLASREIIVCEAIIDALSFWVHGLKNVTAAFGTNGFTDEMLESFLRHNISKVYIAFDADPAGDKAAIELAQRLGQHNIACLRIQFPQGMDANDFIRDNGFKPEMLQNLVDNAVAMTAPVSQPSPAEQPAEPIIAAKEENLAATLPTPEPEMRERNAPAPLKIPSLAAPSTPNKLPDQSSIPTQIKGEDIEITLADRLYRVRGLPKNLSYDTLKVNIRVSCADRYYLDTLDLYNARHRQGFVKAAAEELQVSGDNVHKELGLVLRELERLQEAQIQGTLKPVKPEVKMSAEEEAAALALLKSPNLLDRIAEDYRRCGLVGEDTNVKVGHLLGLTREFDDPVHIIIQSASAAGKSALMDALLAFIPPEKKVKYTAMTGQSLFYMGETELKHKTLAITEKEGAEDATYALKIMESERELRIASTGKDPKTGRLSTHEYVVEGPVQDIVATTAAQLDEEFQNRGVVLTANESREQTQSIQKRQRESETLSGQLWQRQRDKIVKLHQNAQRLLKPMLVVNPYATQLTFLDTQLRTRRDHKKYLILIRAIAFLYQYQREKKQRVVNGEVVQFIEVTLSDIAIANDLVSQVMGTSLDELAPQTRRLLGFIHEMVEKRCLASHVEQNKYRFTRKELRDYTGWSDTQLKVHLERLSDLEYLAIHCGGHRQRYLYELLYHGEGKVGQRFLLGLMDVERLKNGNYDPNRSA